MSTITDGYEVIYLDTADVLPGMGAARQGCYVPRYLADRDAYFGFSTAAGRPGPKLVSRDVFFDLANPQGSSPAAVLASNFIKLRIKPVQSNIELFLDGQSAAILTHPPADTPEAAWQVSVTHPAFRIGNPIGHNVTEIPILFNTRQLDDGQQTHTISAQSHAISFTVANGPRTVCSFCRIDHRTWQLDQFALWWSQTKSAPLATTVTEKMSPSPSGIFNFQTQIPTIQSCSAFDQIRGRIGTLSTFYELSGQHLGSLTMNPDFTLFPGFDPHASAFPLMPIVTFRDIYSSLADCGWASNPGTMESAIIIYPNMNTSLPYAVLVSKPYMKTLSNPPSQDNMDVQLTTTAKGVGCLLLLDVLMDWSSVVFPSVRRSLMGLPCTRSEHPAIIIAKGTSDFVRLTIGNNERFLLWTTGYRAESSDLQQGTGNMRCLGKASDQTEAIWMKATSETGNDARWQRSTTTCTLTPTGTDGEQLVFHAVGLTFSAALWREQGNDISTYSGQVSVSLRSPAGQWVTAVIVDLNHKDTANEFIPTGVYDPFGDMPGAASDAAMSWNGIFRASARDLGVSHFTDLRIELLNGVAGTLHGLQTGMFLEVKPIFYYDLTGNLGIEASSTHSRTPLEIGVGETIQFTASIDSGPSISRLTLEKLHCTETEDDTGSDEARLDIYIDGTLHDSLRRSINNGDDWSLDKSYEIKDWFQVNLWDRDFGPNNAIDSDDCLGTLNRNYPDAGNFSERFTGDSADYTLNYSVDDLRGLTPIERVTSYRVGEDTTQYPVRLDYTYRWDFGDNTIEENALPTISHVYSQPGIYTVVVRCLSKLKPGDSVHNDAYWQIPRDLYGGIGDEIRLQVKVGPYIVNTNTGEVHVSSCKFVELMNQDHKKPFNTLTEAHMAIWNNQRRYDNCAYCLGDSFY